MKRETEYYYSEYAGCRGIVTLSALTRDVRANGERMCDQTDFCPIADASGELLRDALDDGCSDRAARAVRHELRSRQGL